MNRVEDPVFALVAFYDLLDYPLTGVELWRLAQAWGENGSLAHILEQAQRDDRIAMKDGFFSLTGREAIINKRQRRYLQTENVLQRSWKWLQLIAMLPGIRAIFLCNTYGISNPSPTSDIDLFILTEPHRIWTARLWSTGLLRVFRLRPKEGEAPGSICLSFFTNGPKIELATLAQSNRDVYLDVWKQWLIPLYDPDHLRSQLAKRNHIFERPLTRRRLLKNRPAVKRALSFIPIETAARLIQWNIFPDSIRNQANLTTHVMITNEILKFHTNDGRRRYQNAWEARITNTN